MKFQKFLVYLDKSCRCEAFVRNKKQTSLQHGFSVSKLKLEISDYFQYGYSQSQKLHEKTLTFIHRYKQNIFRLETPDFGKFKLFESCKPLADFSICFFDT